MATTKKFVAKNGLDNNNQPIVNVADPQNDQDVATKRSVDTVVNIEVTARTAAVTSVQSNINAEATARAAAVTSLQSDVNAEVTARAAAVATLQSNINAEATARAADMSTLQSSIDTLDGSIGALGNAFNYIGTIAGGATEEAPLDMTTLASGQKDAGDYFKVSLAGYFKVGAGGTPFYGNVGDGLVWNTAEGVDVIDNTNSSVSGTTNFIAVTGAADTGFVVDVAGTFKTRVTTAEADILVEKTARTNADTTLQSNINTVSGNLDAEITSRSNVDSTLTSNLNAEITARTNADTTLQSNINNVTSNLNAEITSRANADTTLQSNINAKQDASTAITTSNIGSQVVASAGKLTTSRTVGGVSFDGTANIDLPGVNTSGTQNTTGSAATLTTGRTIALTGDVTYTSESFNGSANVTGTATLANSGATAGTYGNATNIPQIAIDVKGRITSVSNVAVSIPSGSLTFTGDATGTGSTGSSTALTLASVGIAGTYTKVTTDAKGRVTSGNSLATTDIPALDASKITTGIIDAARLPSYVDDVIEGANLAAFPATGEIGKIYVALDTNKTYRWSGSAYVYITSGAVDSVAGKTGVVTLVKGDVGLGSVDNTADAAKAVLSATKLTTARTVALSGDVTGSVSFDGSANVTISASIAANSVALGTDTTGNYVTSLVAGTGISVGAAGESATPTITNTAPDQTVALTGSGATSISGTYPNFTISSTNTTYTAGNGLTLSDTTLNVGAGAYITVAADSIAVDATSANTASKVVARDSNGDFAGRIITAVDFNATSDIRLKSNVETISNVSDVLMQLRPVSYIMNSTGKKSYGVIAQEIEQILPELVSTNEEGFKSVSYTPLIAFLIETVQSQQKIIDQFNSRLQALENN